MNKNPLYIISVKKIQVVIIIKLILINLINKYDLFKLKRSMMR